MLKAKVKRTIATVPTLQLINNNYAQHPTLPEPHPLVPDGVEAAAALSPHPLRHDGEELRILHTEGNELLERS